MTYEDYLSCSEYSGQAAHPSEANFSAFFHEASQRYFFALLDSAGEVLLKSEGYPQVAARENGIQSVLKNRTNRDFYSVKNEDGKYYISLRAANYREIARSCSCGSEAEALALVDYATGEKVRAAVVAEAAATAERADNKVDDDYMICREYAGHPGVGEDGLVKFTHSNGKHYFAWYDDNGDVLMRSEGYPTTSARDNGYASVLKNRDLEGRYSTLERMGRYFTILKAGNHQEIARSCPHSSEAAALAIYPEARASSKRANLAAESVAAATVVTTVVESAAEEVPASAVTVESAAAEAPDAVVTSSTISTHGVAPVESVEVEDDYLPCRDYEGRNINDKQNNVAMFKHENGQFYFAIYNTDGGVSFRSEGFRTSQERDKELSGALKNLNTPEAYSTIKRGAYSITILKDKTGREVGRSCLNKAVTETTTIVSVPVVVETAAAVEETVEETVVETVEETVVETVVETPVVEVAAFAAAAAAVAEAAPVEAVTAVTETVVVEEAAPVEVVAETVAETVVAEAAAPVDVEDDYLPCGQYEGHNVNDKRNNVAMFKHENGQFYFAIYNADGSVRLRSEGFLTAKDRDQELSGALKNLTNPDMYEVKRRGAYYITVLKDKTGREVGRSCLQKDAPVIAEVVAAAAVEETVVETVVETPVVETPVVEVAAFAAAAAAVAEAAPVEAVTAVTETVVVEEAAPVEVVAETVAETVVAEAAAPVDVEDDYLPCGQYEGHNVNDKRNNVAMFKHENGQFYFAIYNADGSVRLRSEGFLTAKDRDQELSGALKNLTNPDMYEVKRRGAYYITVLKDKTGREVGRSCLQKDAPVIAEVVAAAAPVEVVTETVVEAPVVETSTVEVASFAAVAATAAAMTVVEAPAPVVETIVETVVEAPVVETSTVEADVEDDYLSCHEYEGHTVTDKANNVALFTHANGQYYFAVYNADGSVRLRSEGFRTTADRDGELASVLKNLNNGDKYDTLRRGVYYISILRDDAGHEVGRSCLHKEAPVVVAPKVEVAAVAAVAATAAAVVVETPKVEAPVVVETDVEDDYLPCRDYEGRNINDKQNNVAMFKHENGQYYFAIYNTDGSVRIRSEGFRTSQERDKELSGALKNLLSADMYTTLRRGKYYIHVLKDKTGREVGRSCLMTEEPKAIVAPSVAAPVAAAAAAVVASKLVETQKVEVKKEVVAPKVEVKKVVEAKRVVEAAAPVAEVVEEAATGGFNWWWLLLPLLLGALWFFKDGCNKPEVVAPTTAVEVPVDTAAKAAAPVVAQKAMGCTVCAGGTSDDDIFTSVCENPKKLSRLGTNPEFGNSHKLSPEGFYNKIKKAYADNEVDRVFLDRIYKSMGYEGFKDAKADQFSAVVLPQGTSGKLGYSKAHKTGCYTLPDDEYHRKAFHIKSANGCDLHFMKTCGNHFFFCKN